VIKLGSVVIDAAIEETHSHTVEVTEYPTEGGRNLADHSRYRPFELSISAVVSDTPSPKLAALRESQVGGTILTVSEFVYLQLQQLLSDPNPITITTSLGAYENMRITSINIDRNAAKGRALKFSLTAKRIDIVGVVRVVVRTVNKNNKGFRGAFVGNVSVETKVGSLEQKKAYDRGAGKTPRFVFADGKPVFEKGSKVTKVEFYKQPTKGLSQKQKPNVRKPDVKPIWQGRLK
jgi:hypothetical protein